MSWSVQIKEKSGAVGDAAAVAIGKQLALDNATTLAAILAYFQLVARDVHNNGNDVVMNSSGHTNSDGSGSWDIHIEIPTPVKVDTVVR